MLHYSVPLKNIGLQLQNIKNFHNSVFKHPIALTTSYRGKP